MCRILFLTLLLWVDWELDTSFGTSPLSRPLSSTEAVCHSLSFKHDLAVKIQSLIMPTATCLSGSFSSPAQQPIPAALLEASPSWVLGDELLYLLQSFQC
jgi:hypothetical protein